MFVKYPQHRGAEQKASALRFVSEDGVIAAALRLPQLITTRERLLADIRRKLDGAAKAFLLSLHDTNPDFGAIGLPQASELPAVQWKLLNLRKLKDQNPRKHEEHRVEIERLFL
ncbi:hypothetical protein GCM10007919_15310 [Rhizobium indigoferae]|jgi:hypothetical protein|nr:hypothetical protein GCM10007919_15310 [Rhizobium indigoferae]